MPVTNEEHQLGKNLRIRDVYKQQGFSENVVKIICSSWRHSTIEQYEVYITKWNNFCSEREINPLSTDEPQILNFLASLFDDGSLQCY